MAEHEEKISLLQERVAVVENKVSTAHTRIDKMELLMRDDLKEIKHDIKENIDALTSKVNVLISFMDKWKSMAAVAILACGAIGFIIQNVLSALLRIWVK